MNRLKVQSYCLFIALCVNSFGQNKTNTFEVVKSGQGSKSMIFIQDFQFSAKFGTKQKQSLRKIILVTH
jgi:hypothetical protein